MMAERNYSTIEHEALTTVSVVKEFNQYIYVFVWFYLQTALPHKLLKMWVAIL